VRSGQCPSNQSSKAREGCSTNKTGSQQRAVILVKVPAKKTENRDRVAKLLFLSLIIGIVVIPTRLSKGTFSPKRVVRAYVFAAIAYGFSLLYIMPRVGF
jgi:hypothetical protein